MALSHGLVGAALIFNVNIYIHLFGFRDQDDKDQVHEQLQLSKNSRRAPLRQLFPRTPTPFKKAYAAAVRKGGQVEQIDLEKSVSSVLFLAFFAM